MVWRGGGGGRDNHLSVRWAPHSLAEVNEEPRSPSGRWQGAFKCAIRMALEEANVPGGAGGGVLCEPRRGLQAGSIYLELHS